MTQLLCADQLGEELVSVLQRAGPGVDLEEVVGRAVTRANLAQRVACNIRLGVYEDTDELVAALDAAGTKYNDLSREMLHKTPLCPTELSGDIQAVEFTTAELTGKSEGGTTAEVFAGAARLGLRKMPAEAGPQYLLQNPEPGWRLIGMEPIVLSDGIPLVFYVGRDGSGLWLDVLYADPGCFWRGADRWLFRPRK
jgi:hypothetical protein